MSFLNYDNCHKCHDSKRQLLVRQDKQGIILGYKIQCVTCGNETKWHSSVNLTRKEWNGEILFGRDQVAKAAKRLIEELQEEFPFTFPHKPLSKVPLKIGIANDVRDWAQARGYSRDVARKAMQFWCDGPRYKQALAKPGAYRVDLYGRYVEPVKKIQTPIIVRTVAIKRKCKDVMAALERLALAQGFLSTEKILQGE